MCDFEFEVAHDQTLTMRKLQSIRLTVVFQRRQLKFCGMDDGQETNMPVDDNSSSAYCSSKLKSSESMHCQIVQELGHKLSPFER